MSARSSAALSFVDLLRDGLEGRPVARFVETQPAFATEKAGHIAARPDLASGLAQNPGHREAAGKPDGHLKQGVVAENRAGFGGGSEVAVEAGPAAVHLGDKGSVAPLGSCPESAGFGGGALTRFEVGPDEAALAGQSADRTGSARRSLC